MGSNDYIFSYEFLIFGYGYRDPISVPTQSMIIFINNKKIVEEFVEIDIITIFFYNYNNNYRHTRGKEYHFSCSYDAFGAY